MQPSPGPQSLIMMLLPLVGLVFFVVPPFFLGYFIGKGRGYREGVEAAARLKPPA